MLLRITNFIYEPFVFLSVNSQAFYHVSSNVILCVYSDVYPGVYSADFTAFKSAIYQLIHAYLALINPRTDLLRRTQIIPVFTCSVRCNMKLWYVDRLNVKERIKEKGHGTPWFLTLL